MESSNIVEHGSNLMTTNNNWSLPTFYFGVDRRQMRNAAFQEAVCLESEAKMSIEVAYEKTRIIYG